MDNIQYSGPNLHDYLLGDFEQGPMQIAYSVMAVKVRETCVEIANLVDSQEADGTCAGSYEAAHKKLLDKIEELKKFVNHMADYGQQAEVEMHCHS